MRKRNRHKIIIGIEVMILSITVSLLGTNAASSNPPSNGVSYNKNGQVTVQNALDNLYSKANYGNATANDILKGKKALVGGKEVVGTFTCPTLASLTPGDATPEDITDGKIAWVNGNKIIGTKNVSLVDEVKLGDYISYTPSNSVESIPFEKGISYKVTDNWYLSTDFDPSELNVWRVLKKNHDGTIDLVSKHVSQAILDAAGSGDWWKENAYNHYLEALNTIAKQYETEGITVGSRHIGYNKLFEVSKNACTADNGYLEDVLLLRDISAVRVTTPNGTNIYSYALASRKSCLNEVVYEMGYDDSNDFVQYANIEYLNFKLRIRPVVVLKSTLKIIGGNGTETAPYILGV